MSRTPEAFEVCLVAHLRAVKDPLLAARATELLPRTSRIRVLHCGAALEPALRIEVEQAASRNPRYQWLGPLSHGDAMRTICASHALLVTSRSEGGANVVSEAVINDVPVLSTRIDGSVGLLGVEYPGYFPVGDAGALAQVLSKFELDATFRRTLERACAARKPLFEVDRERAAWAALLGAVLGEHTGEHD
jgi:glycosyltransferase involved in cell wall biosynthesis